jgi:hypothetical protein
VRIGFRIFSAVEPLHPPKHQRERLKGWSLYEGAVSSPDDMCTDLVGGMQPAAIPRFLARGAFFGQSADRAAESIWIGREGRKLSAEGRHRGLGTRCTQRNHPKIPKQTSLMQISGRLISALCPSRALMSFPVFPIPSPARVLGPTQQRPTRARSFSGSIRANSSSMPTRPPNSTPRSAARPAHERE